MKVEGREDEEGGNTIEPRVSLKDVLACNRFMHVPRSDKCPLAPFPPPGRTQKDNRFDVAQPLIPLGRGWGWLVAGRKEGKGDKDGRGGPAIGIKARSRV